MPTLPGRGEAALPWMDSRPVPRVRIAPAAPMTALAGVDWPGDVALFEVVDPGALQEWL